MQKRTFSYLADDLTFDINTRLLGLLPPGLYRGFDADLKSGLTLNLVHDKDGLLEVDSELELSDRTGIIITKQGVTIRENAVINVSIPTNAGSADPRIDLIILEHQYQEVEGGTQAIYGVIPGIPEPNPVAGNLTNPNKQVVIGELYLPGGCASLDTSGVVWTKRQHPRFAEALRDIQVASIVNGELVTEVPNCDNYYLTFGQVQAGYQVINKILLTTQNNRYINVVSDYKLKINPGETITTVGNQPVYIEAYEIFTLASIGVYSQYSTPGSTKWYVLKGGEAKMHQENKFRQRVSVSKFQGTLLISGNKLSIGSGGNIFDVNNVADAELKWITKFDTTDSYENDSGGFILLRFLNSVKTTIKHLATGNGSDSKQIFIPNEEDIEINEPTDVFLWENSSEYRIIAVQSSVYSGLEAIKRLNEMVISDLVDVENSINFTSGDILMWLQDESLTFKLRPTNFDDQVKNKPHLFTARQDFKTANVDLTGAGGGSIDLNSTANFMRITIDNGVTITNFDAGANYENGSWLFLRFKLVTPSGAKPKINLGTTYFEEIGFGVDQVDIYDNTTMIVKKENDKWVILYASSLFLPMIGEAVWNSETLVSPWSGYTVSEFKTFKYNDRVRIRGRFQDAGITGASGFTEVVTLGNSYRPADTLIFPVVVNDVESGSLKIEPDGKVSIAYENVGVGSSINLGEIEYIADNLAIPD